MKNIIMIKIGFDKTFRINNIINPIITSFVSYSTNGLMAMVMGYYLKVQG
jgi:hypothetical protein